MARVTPHTTWPTLEPANAANAGKTYTSTGCNAITVAGVTRRT